MWSGQSASMTSWMSQWACGLTSCLRNAFQGQAEGKGGHKRSLSIIVNDHLVKYGWWLSGSVWCMEESKNYTFSFLLCVLICLSPPDHPFSIEHLCHFLFCPCNRKFSDQLLEYHLKSIIKQCIVCILQFTCSSLFCRTVMFCQTLMMTSVQMAMSSPQLVVLWVWDTLKSISTTTGLS